MRAAGTFSHHKSIIESFVKKGHSVLAFFDKEISKKSANKEELDKLKTELGEFNYEYVASRQDWWRHILLVTREVLSYRHYLLMGDQSDFYRRDWIKFLPGRLRPLVWRKESLANRIIMSMLLKWIFSFIEKISPPDRNIMANLKKYKPDVVLATPLNFRHSSADLEYFKAAKWLGIPAVLPVYSWDNLTVRGLVHIVPDLVLAWNEVQAEEAIIHHNIPRSIIKITGAFLFDRWFTYLVPSRDRRSFCSEYGIRAEDPYLVYLGSSRNIAENEVWLVKHLRRALDASGDPNLARVQIVIRPHPAHFGIYEELDGEKNIYIIPRHGSLPSTKAALQLFYDTLHYSIGTVGINTSGMIDALIADKPGIAMVTEKYKETQFEALHFKQIFEAKALCFAETNEEFIVNIRDFFGGRDECQQNRREFIKKFIRPRGIDMSAGDLAVKEVEQLINKV